jgi:hypothetical protein
MENVSKKVRFTELININDLDKMRFNAFYLLLVAFLMLGYLLLRKS